MNFFDTKEHLDQREAAAKAKGNDSKAGDSNQRNRSNKGGGNKRVAIEINQEIIRLGRNRQWKEILALYEQQKEDFDHIDYATVMSQLGRI